MKSANRLSGSATNDEKRSNNELKKHIISIFAILAMAVSFTAMLSGCGSDSDSVTINVYNWGQYISEGDDDCIDVIAEFEDAYPNIHVNYTT